jgi:hypothetical protein
MKKVLAGCCVLLSVVAVSVSAGSLIPRLKLTKDIPAFTAPADKALVVVVRPVQGNIFNNTDGYIVQIYCDTKHVTQTIGKTVVKFEADPGEHFITCKADQFGTAGTKDIVKLNLAAGKVYYITMNMDQVRPPVGPTIVKVESVMASADEAKQLLEKGKGKIQYGEFDKTKAEDLKAEDLKGIQDDYAKWAAEKDNADKAKKQAEYQGF